MSGFTFKMDSRYYERETQKFLALLPKRMREPAVRKIAFDVMSDWTVGIGGMFGNPKRIDTGRYRASPGVAAKAAGIPGASKLPKSKDSQPSDGSAKWVKTGDTTGLTVTSHVEYGPYVEWGTRFMEPGKHLATALVRVGNDTREVRKQLEQGLKDAAK